MNGWSRLPESVVFGACGEGRSLRDFDIIAATEYIGSFNDRPAGGFYLSVFESPFFCRRRFADVFDSIQTNKNSPPFPPKRKKKNDDDDPHIRRIIIYTHFTTFGSYMFLRRKRRHVIALD